MTAKQEWTQASMFPEPLNERYFLWAHHWEDYEEGMWSHPGILEEDDPRMAAQGGGLTTAQAVEDSRRMTAFWFERVAAGVKSARSIIWGMAARYQWLCEFTEARDPVLWSDTVAWAKGRLPEIEDGQV